MALLLRWPAEVSCRHGCHFLIRKTSMTTSITQAIRLIKAHLELFHDCHNQAYAYIKPQHRTEKIQTGSFNLCVMSEFRRNQVFCNSNNLEDIVSTLAGDAIHDGDELVLY